MCPQLHDSARSLVTGQLSLRTARSLQRARAALLVVGSPRRGVGARATCCSRNSASVDTSRFLCELCVVTGAASATAPAARIEGLPARGPA